MSEGTKELKEALVGALKLSTAMAEQMKDGLQPVADVSALVAKMQTEPLKSALEAAYRDANKVPAEVSDLSVVEVIELIPVIMPEILALAQALKKPAA